jgi:hypothetical protein
MPDNRSVVAKRGASKLRKQERERLARAQAQGEMEVVALIAAVPGENEAATREIARLGGTVRYREDAIDYIRAKAPTAQVETVASLRAVQTIFIEDSRISTKQTSAGDETADGPPTSNSLQRAIPAPDRNTPAENPYLPTRDIGAPQFITTHPTFDGRGVGIAIIDFLPDILLPELQTATTLDGKPARKIVDVLTAADPADGETGYHVKMSDQVAAAGGVFTYKDVSYTAPRDGAYRIGLYARRKQPCAVLWDEKANTVWVDSNQNRSFADEKAMTDYDTRYDVGAFGKDDPATPVRESVGFVVKTYPETKYVAIFSMGASHGTMVASAAAGKAFFGGRMNGAAPEAQIISFGRIAGPLVYPVLEQFIIAAKHPKVDLISASTGHNMPFDDSHSTLSVILNRLVEKYKKPIFLGAGNSGVTLNSVSELANGGNVISVGGYLHKESWLALFGVEAVKDEYVTNESSRGPSEDGGFKPDIIVPLNGISAWPATGPSRMLTDAYKLPPGYATGGGTSYACPMAAGAAALLISAAKQSGIPYDAARIRWAMKSSARYIPGYGAYEQGAGLVNIPAAWELLKRAPTPVVIATQAPVKTLFSQYLNEPNRGRGIYERDGWAAGQTGERTITFTRASGDQKPVTYEARWVGNDGTFISPAKISLPLNKPVNLPVTVSPKTEGVHSAILNLVDPKTGYPIHEVMNTVVAAAQLTADSGFTITRAGEAEWLGYKSFFINVPAGASAVKFEMEFGEGEVRVDIHDPVNGNYLSRPVFPEVIPGIVMYQKKGRMEQTFAHPVPGVWEVNVQNWDRNLPGRNGARKPADPFTLRASVFGVEAASSVISIDTSAAGGNGAQTINLINRFSGFNGGLVDTPLGSAFTAQPSLTEGGAPHIYEIDVPPGAQLLSAAITRASDKSADLDLYLYDCAGKDALLRDYSNGPGADEAVSIPNPRAGKWKVVIDPVRIPAGKTTVAYEDIYTNPAHGMLRSSESPSGRRSGQKWSAAARVEIGEPPKGNRRLAAVAEIGSGKAETVGVQRAKFYEMTAVQQRVLLGIIKIELRR